MASRRPVDEMNADQQTFADHRTLLFSVAYRILGSAADAEDVVQDAWFKWSADDRSQVSDPKAYLARIVSNLSMERLRSTRHQRETYVGPWLPEPILTDAAEDVADADSVSMAMLVVLETLSPLERAVFVLKEVFDFSYAEIGEAVERSESAVRQAAHRAREHVQARRPRFEADRVKKREATERFFAATVGGDINELMELLAPEVTLWTDGGGKVRQAMRPIIGAVNVARWIAGSDQPALRGRRNRRHDSRSRRHQRRPGHRDERRRSHHRHHHRRPRRRRAHRDRPQRRQPGQTARGGRRGQEDLSRLRCGTGRDPLIDSGAILPTCERHCRCQRLGRALVDNIHVVTENSAR